MKNKTCRKIFSLFLTLNISLYHTSAFANSNIPNISAPHSISPSFGKIEETFQGTSGKTIFYIQDAHDSLEAQKNIAKIIHELVAKQGVQTVFEEGYEGPVPTDELFSEITDPELKEKVSYYLMDHLRLGGAEYAHINRNQGVRGLGLGVSKNQPPTPNTQPLNFNLIGIDNIDLHFKHVEHYKALAEQRTEIDRDLNVMASQMRRLGNKVFSKEIKSYLKLKERFKKHQVSLSDYLRRASDFLNKNFTEKDFPSTHLLLSVEKNPSEDALRKIQSIDFRDVFQEIQKMETSIAQQYLTSARDQKIFQFLSELDLIRSLSHMEMTAEEFDAAKTLLKNFKTQAVADFLARENKRTIVLSKFWESQIQHAIGFYETAHKRDETLEEKLRDWGLGVGDWKNQPQTPGPQPPAILVFGGFHKNNIKKILQRHQISYVILTPKITEISKRHQDQYKMLMAGGRYSFETPIAARADRPTSFPLRADREIGLAAARSELRTLAKSLKRVKKYLEPFGLLLSGKLGPTLNQGSLMDAIFSEANEAMVVTDAQGNIVEWNKRAQEMLGYSREEVLGTPWAPLVVKSSNWKQFEADLTVHLDQGQEHAARIETILTTKTKQEFPAEISASNVSQRNGSISQNRIFVIRNISTRKRNHNELTNLLIQNKRLGEMGTELNDVLDAVPGAVFEFRLNPLTQEMKFSYLSAGAERLLRVPRTRMLEDFSSAWNLVHPEDRKKLRESILEAVKDPQKPTYWEYDFRVIIEGKEVWLRGTSEPQNAISSTEKEITFNGALIDITELKKTHEQLLAAQQIVAAKELENQLELLSSGLAHHINNALGATDGYLVLLEEDLKGSPSSSDPERIELYLKNAREGAKKIGDVLKRLAQLMPRETGEPRNSKVRANGIMREMEQRISQKFKGFPIQLQLEATDQSYLPGEIDGINLAFEEIVVNAVEASLQKQKEKGGSFKLEPVILKTFVEEKQELDQAARIVLEIKDTGVGIPPNEFSSIFKPFFRGKLKDATHHGLGLPIAANFIYRFQGDINIQSDETGTTVRVSFPLVSPPAIKSAQPEAPTQLSQGLSYQTIYIVDDEPAIRQLAELYLKREWENSEIVTFENGAVALEAIREKAPNLLITDMTMPTMTGNQLVQEIRAFNSQMTIVVMTGNDLTATQQLFSEGQVDGYIPKPFNPPLVEFIKSLNPHRSELRKNRLDLLNPSLPIQPEVSDRNISRAFENKATVFIDAGDIAALTDQQFAADIETTITYSNATLKIYGDKSLISSERLQALQQIKNPDGTARVFFDIPNFLDALKITKGKVAHISKRHLISPELLKKYPYLVAFKYQSDEIGVVATALLYADANFPNFSGQPLDLSRVGGALQMKVQEYLTSLVIGRAA